MLVAPNLRAADIEREKIVLRVGMPERGGAPAFARDGGTVALDDPQRGFWLGYRGLRYTPHTLDDAGQFCAIFGHLIEGDHIVAKPDLAAFDQIVKDESHLRSLNGEFLIIHLDKRSGRLTCAVDRYASVQWHYTVVNGTFVGSFAFADICDEIAKRSRLQWDAVSALEYLKFRRVHGDRTLAENVRFLRAGCLIRFDGGDVQVRRYFTPRLETRACSLNESGEALAAAIARSVARKTSDGEKYGLFLSGGQDTRSVLAAAPTQLTCFTVGFHERTREILRARELAQLKSCPHRTIVLSPDHYEAIFATAVLQNGGQYSVANIFTGLGGVVSDIDVGLCGTGLDYMFQGMYMPAGRVTVMGRPLAWRWRKTVPQNVAEHYLAAYSSRLKFARIDDHLTDSAALNAAMRDRLGAIEAEARALTDDTDFIWNHMFLADPSRHYSYPDNLGMRTDVELRTPAFDNDVYDLFQSMPMTHRFDRRAVRVALARLNPSFLRVPNANDDLPITSSAGKTYHQVKAALVRRWRGAPIQSGEVDRTWPTNAALLSGSDLFRESSLALADSPAATLLPSIDFGKVGALAARWHDSPPAAREPHAADFLWNIMGLAAFVSRYA
jgi:asparagine synthetase B (glutamine-hydrolysing)